MTTSISSEASKEKNPESPKMKENTVNKNHKWTKRQGELLSTCSVIIKS